MAKDDPLRAFESLVDRLVRIDAGGCSGAVERPAPAEPRPEAETGAKEKEVEPARPSSGVQGVITLDAEAQKSLDDALSGLSAAASAQEVAATASSAVENKIDALERLIEQWRIVRHKLTNPLEFEDFIDWKWFADTDRIVFAPIYSIETKGFGTPPIRLQRKLLAFLLLYHDRYKQVLEIIGEFISKIRKDLCTLDFKKTKTGVFRCYTNTRFAANKLRDYGLLKFTHSEAYKTWVLSLPGFLVAARALEKPDWEIPDVVKDPWHDLDPFIYTCCAGLHDYPLFVQRLKSICQPNAKIFETFDTVLRQAHRQLIHYWRVLGDPEQPTKDRRALSKQIVDELDQTVGYGEFLNELSACIQIEHILRKADAAARE